jgi:hypothetical protein
MSNARLSFTASCMSASTFSLHYDLIERNLDRPLIADDVEEVVVDGIAHVVLRDFVRPEIDDVM